jgi:quercetin dioxygenase-like cupin family protein
MALHHAVSGEIVDIRPLGKKLKDSIPVTLVKTAHLQVFRYILLQGNEFAEHKVPGEITVQCLEGVVEFTSQNRKQMLQAGEFVYLTSDDPHALKGIKDASVLVTIVSNKPA